MTTDEREKAQEAVMLATVANTKIASHEAECARRYEDLRQGTREIKDQIYKSNEKMRETVDEMGKSVSSSIEALKAHTDIRFEKTHDRISGIYKMLLASSGATLLCILGVLLEMLFSYFKH